MKNKIQIHQIDSHPIVKQWYDLMQEFEKIPASEQQTKCITELGKLGESFQKYYNDLFDDKLETKPEPSLLEVAMHLKCHYPKSDIGDYFNAAERLKAENERRKNDKMGKAG